MTCRATVYSVGHGTLSESDLVDLLHQTGVAHVLDVRSYPGSRRNPQYGQEQLERWLPAAGIGDQGTCALAADAPTLRRPTLHYATRHLPTPTT